jgi:hypothetical protein
MNQFQEISRVPSAAEIKHWQDLLATRQAAFLLELDNLVLIVDRSNSKSQRVKSQLPDFKHQIGLQIAESSVAILENQVFEAQNELQNAVLARETHLPRREELNRALYASGDLNLQLDILKDSIDDLMKESEAELAGRHHTPKRDIEIQAYLGEESPETFERSGHRISSRPRHPDLRYVYDKFENER